jgi:hypothetical protein
VQEYVSAQIERLFPIDGAVPQASVEAAAATVEVVIGKHPPIVIAAPWRARTK